MLPSIILNELKPTSLLSHLKGVQFEAENIFICAANLSVLHQRILDLSGYRHSLPQQWGIIPEISLHAEDT